MPRHHKIFAGPFSEATSQAHEAIAVSETLPGQAVVYDAQGRLALAPASTDSMVMIAQDNYLVMLGVGTPWSAGDRMIALEMLDEQLFNVRVPTGTAFVKGTPVTTNATGRFIPATEGDRIIAFAMEAYTNASGADQLLRVRKGTYSTVTGEAA